MTLNEMKAKNPKDVPNKKRYKTHKYAHVLHVYLDQKDAELYDALCRKYPSRRKGAANLTAFVRAHEKEILG